MEGHLSQPREDRGSKGFLEEVRLEKSLEERKLVGEEVKRAFQVEEAAPASP